MPVEAGEVSGYGTVEGWYQELKDIDVHTRRARDWLEDVSACLLANGFDSIHDLRGASLEMLTESRPSGGKLAFLRRVLDSANAPAPDSAAGCGGQSSAVNVQGALQCLSSQAGGARRAAIDWQSALDSVSLKGLSAGAWPSVEFVETLKLEIDRLRDKGVAQPFIYVDIQKKVGTELGVGLCAMR